MAINRDNLNNDLQQKVNRPNAVNTITTNIGEIAYSKTVNESTLIGRAAGEVVNGFKSLEQTQDFVNTVNTTGDALTQITENVPGYGVLMNLDDISYNISGVGVDSESLVSAIDPDGFFDSAVDLTGLFSSVGSIGGGIADTVSSIIKLITLLGTISKLTNISISGSATDAIGAAGKSLADKASNLTGSISDAVGNLGDIADVSSLSELSGVVNNIGGDLGEIVGAVSAVADFNPLAEGLGAIADVDLGAVAGLGQIGDAFGDVTSGINEVGQNIDNILENGLSAVTGEVLGALGGVIGPINDTIVNSTGGILQNVNEALNSEFTKNIVNLTGGALVAKSAVGDLMDKVTSRDPFQVAQAAKTISGLSSRIPDSMKSIVSGIGDVNFSNSRELVNSVIEKAIRDKIPQSEIDAFLSEFRNIEDTLPTLDTTIQSSLERTNNQFFDENVNLKDYGVNYSTTSPTGQPQTPNFTTVASKEELGQEVMLAKRPVLYLVIHSTESYNNQYLTAREIHRDHVDRGFDGIQYHYIIRRDGTLERGLPTNSVAQSSPTELRNFTLDVALVGGINAPSGVENPDQYRSIEAFTREQLTTMESFIEAFYRRYPGGLVRGHYQIEDGVQDPHFDLKKFVKNRFGRS